MVESVGGCIGNCLLVEVVAGVTSNPNRAEAGAEVPVATAGAEADSTVLLQTEVAT